MEKYIYQTVIAGDIGCLVSEVESKIKVRIADRIINKQEQIRRLLENGRDVMVLARGKSFDRIYQQRQKLWLILSELTNVLSIIYDIK